MPNVSTWTLWSMTRSTGTSGLIRCGSPPARFMADRIAARSTTAGTPVKSCRMTRAGLNGSSAVDGVAALHLATAVTSASVTSNPSMFRRQLSSSTLIENGSGSSLATPSSASRLSR